MSLNAPNLSPDSQAVLLGGNLTLLFPQLDVLNQDVCLADILMYDVTLVVFMEFLESKKSENHVLFWISVEAFQQHLKVLLILLRGTEH